MYTHTPTLPLRPHLESNSLENKKIFIRNFNLTTFILLQMEGIGDKIYELGIAELAKREREVRAFEESIRVAQKAAQDKGIAEVRYTVRS